MHAGCSPKLFYTSHRPLLSGWKDNPALPEGLVYEGVSHDPVQYSGGSAAQSAAVQIVDAGLGVHHDGPEGQFLVRMRSYMPPNQRDLVFLVSSRSGHLRSICTGVPELERGYNQCLETLAEFRTQHLILVSRYITTQVNDT